MEPYSAASRFPTRRRVVQACVACRMRKTRCDAVQPRCGYCAMHNIDCVYRDSQQPRIDYNTQVLLERIQLLEDRLTNPSAQKVQESGREPQQKERREPQDNGGQAFDIEIQIPRSHTANANHVYSWPIVRQLLSEADQPTVEPRDTDVTKVFFGTGPDYTGLPPSSWRLYTENPDAASRHRQFINAYFAHVNVFFPLLSAVDIRKIHDAVIAEDARPNDADGQTLSSSQYALLLLVLCFGSFMEKSGNMIRLQQEEHTSDNHEEESIWGKAKLLLGHVSPQNTLAAAQCTMLACLYCGAKGRVSESFSWAHTSAVKCEALARVFTQGETSSDVPDEFSRLFWTVFIVEGDFVSEVSVTLPSGLPRYEELIPYPTFMHPVSSEDADTNVAQQEEVMAFQITTNASIRRFLNRVNSAVYTAKEQQRQQSDRGADHALWLLHVAQDLWSHHAAVYRNLPSFLLTSDTSTTTSELSPSSYSPTAHIAGLIPRGNNPWNIVRLQGRYFAGQYIIHRPFVEYALLNASTFDTHPSKAPILAGCKTCFEGCAGFIRVFDVDPANSITCLFATGMATFTMTMILMIATVSPLFRDFRLDNVEDSIYAGLRNLQRFSRSVKEFDWHLRTLQLLDSSRRSRLQAHLD